MKYTPFIAAGRRARRRRGSIAVFVALSLTMLLICGGFAVNYGLLAADANRAQRACDAAAMAGVYELGTSLTLSNLGAFTNNQTAARNTAKDIAAKNGLTLADNQVKFFYNGTEVTGSALLANEIQVNGTLTRAFFLNKFLGQDSGNVRRSAKAKISPASDMSSMGGGKYGSVAPIGITWDTYNAYRQAMDLNGNRPSVELTLIRQNKNTFSRDPLAVDADPFVLFDLRDTNAKSGPHMQSQLEGDEIETVALNDWENTLNAALNSEGKKLEDGVDTLLDRATGAPWYDTTGVNGNPVAANSTINRTNPRVINLIVTPPTTKPNNGTFNTQVQGFAPVYIHGVYEETVDGEQVMRLLVTFLPPSIISGEISTPSTSNHWTGNYTTSMVE